MRPGGVAKDVITAQALSVVSEALSPDRALILSRTVGRDWKVEATSGVDMNVDLQALDVSFEVFDSVYKDAQPLWTAEAKRHPDFQDSFSLQLSDVRTIVATPLYHPTSGVWGVLYADRQSDSPAFQHDDLKWLLVCARRLESALFEGKKLDIPLPEKKRAASGVRRVRTRKTLGNENLEKEQSELRKLKPKSRSVVIFIRSLSTMIKVGLPLADCFDCLTNEEDDKAMSRVVQAIGQRVLSGRPLSKALQSFPRVFSSFHVEMIRTGEETGSLHEVLELLADLEERNQALTYGLRSALVYPAFVAGFCLLGVIFLPPFALRGQLEFLQASGAEIPVITKLLIAFSNTVTSPVFLVIFTLALLFAGWYMTAADGAQKRRRSILKFLERRALVGSILRSAMQARFFRALYLGLRAGQPLVAGLQQAVRVSGHANLMCFEDSVKEQVVEGASVTEVLKKTGCFDPNHLYLLEVGEQTGAMEAIADRCATLSEFGFRRSVEALPSILEPILTFIVGMMVAGFLIATLSPTLSLLKQL